MKPVTEKDIARVNRKNPCALKVCPKCGCEVWKQRIASSQSGKVDIWISGCPRCNYSFCD